MRHITCPRCNGAGERCCEVTERWHRCITCNATGTIASGCTTTRAPLRVDEPTPMASAILDAGGNEVDL